MQIDFHVEGREGCIARRHWPSAPRIGETVFLPELMGELRITSATWGSTLNGAGEPITGECEVTLQGLIVDEEESVPPTERATATIVVQRDEILTRKLATARAALYDVKLGIESSEGHDVLERTIITALDSTTDESADIEHDARKRVKELEAEVLSLRGQLARALHAKGVGV